MTTRPIAQYSTADERRDFVESNLTNAPRLRLHRNESRTAMNPQLLSTLAADDWQRYPDAAALQSVLSQSLSVDPERIVITAGGDEGIDRMIRYALRGQRKQIVTHEPAFDMFPIYTQNAGGTWDGVNWLCGDFPTTEFLAKLSRDTALVILVSPNNPTGQVIPTAAWEAILQRTRALDIPVLADLAYIEYATENPSSALSREPHVTVVRTFSKAWGLAGLRVGYLVAPDVTTAAELRGMGGPFPVSGVSLKLAQVVHVTQHRLMEQHVHQTQTMRLALTELLRRVGAEPLESQANFVLARWPGASAMAAELRQQNILVRTFAAPHPLANDWLRVTCPTSLEELQRLAAAWGIADLGHLVNEQEQQLAGQAEAASAMTADSADSLGKPVTSAAFASPSRVATISRHTKETQIELQVDLDGRGQVFASTGLGFFDHMLTALGHHARLDLNVRCAGDLHVDDHHTVEDIALALGTALDRALGERRGVQRFGYAYAPLDEALARCVIDLSGRAAATVELRLVREMIGSVASENLTHFFQSLAQTLRCAIHLEVLAGTNDHHRAEAAFKATALALRQAIQIVHQEIPSTKGVLA